MWTEEVYRIHEMDLAYKPAVNEGIKFYAPESRPVIEQAVQKAIEHGEPFDVELEIITAKGNRRFVNAIGKADSGRRRVYGFFQDITERKKADLLLQDKTNKLESAMNNIKVLSGLLPVCSHCMKIRDDKGS